MEQACCLQKAQLHERVASACERRSTNAAKPAARSLRRCTRRRLSVPVAGPRRRKAFSEEEILHKRLLKDVQRATLGTAAPNYRNLGTACHLLGPERCGSQPALLPATTLDGYVFPALDVEGI